MKRNPQVDQYLSETNRWRDELKQLRALLLASPLQEELKWGYPCYTYEQSNIVGINRMKDYCALGFFKGALLKDAEGVLVKPGENSQSMRQMRFTDPREIVRMKPVIMAYIHEAIEAEKAGLKIEFKAITELVYGEELQKKLIEDHTLKTAFEALTPGRRRAYNLHFSGAKQSETRASRIEKCIPQILAGKGLHDCVCGLSKKPPQCDGSHKQLR